MHAGDSGRSDDIDPDGASKVNCCRRRCPKARRAATVATSGRAELLSGVESVSSRPVRKIVLCEG